MLNTQTPRFCPKKDCKCYQKLDNKITKDGTYTVESSKERRQMYYCHGGEHRFSEMAYTELLGKHGSVKEYEQTAKLISYGLSIEQIADTLEKDPRTIQEWVKGIAKKSQNFHEYVCQTVGIILLFIQMDELWSYLKNKKRQLWVFIAMEAKTKFWINFEAGSRTNHTANRLVERLKSLMRVNPSQILRITTDKLAAYKNALEKQLTDINYSYLQIVKRRVKRKLKTVSKFLVKGSESDFPAGTQNTSYVERLNLTLRQRISYLQRKTIGYCKKKIHAAQMLWINLVDYNYCQFHKSLRIDLTGKKEQFKKRYQHITPAMKIGLTTCQLNWRYLLFVPIPKPS